MFFFVKLKLQIHLFEVIGHLGTPGVWKKISPVFSWLSPSSGGKKVTFLLKWMEGIFLGSFFTSAWDSVENIKAYHGPYLKKTAGGWVVPSNLIVVFCWEHGMTCPLPLDLSWFTWTKFNRPSFRGVAGLLCVINRTKLGGCFFGA